MNENNRFIRYVAVVTGGGSGIGAACCRELAGDGALVAVLDQNGEAAQRLANEVGGAAFECDVSSEDQLRETARRIESDLGAVRTLVNSAGIVQGHLSAYDLPMQKWDDIVRIDQRGTYLSCIAFARAMLERRCGSIVNIASVAGMRSMPLHAYAPAKAAVISMTETLAAEWGASGIRVNAVSPGFTMTERMRAAITKGIMDVKPLTSTAALHRLVEPSEVAKAVAFLASDDASAITGINLPVDCGWLAGATWSAYGGLPDGPN
jgi:NAD(P)-dependent dehydrogenase (short-subunit alcohol dehydrogenase family)